MKKIIKIILLIICLGVFTYSAYNIYKYISEENANEELNGELIDNVITETSDNNEKKLIPFNVDFSLLQKENKDVVGWIYSESTPINYPVVQSMDNEYYLHRLINGEYNSSGSIFMDYRNNPNLEDSNTIIYGHNMKNDLMFGTLQEYKSQEYYESHKEIYYFTPEKNYKIELFSGYTISVDSDIYNLSTINDEKKEELISKSDFKSDVNINEDDKIITLSTCSYDYEGARYIVMGILQELKN